MKISLSIKVLLPILIVLSIVAFIVFEYQKFITTPLNIDSGGYNYTVKSGSYLRQISDDLSQQKLSPFPSLYLYSYGRLEEKAHLIKAGEYHIEQGTTLPQLLEQFIEGKVIQYSMTIIDGMTSQMLIDQVAESLQLRHTLVSNNLADVMLELGLGEQYGEGLFYPETYYFPFDTTDLSFLKRANKQMMLNLDREWQARADDLPYKSAYEALIMASIIEKESGIAEERPQIAGVFVRRLQKGMRLQTDPTVIYGMGKSYKGNIRRKDLRTDTPYNTYTRFGLPPSPIALPSIESIHAALHPADGKSLYFVATGTEGRHVFSSNLKDHNKAVRRYQLKK